MCGIAGSLQLRPERPAVREEVERMCAVLRHRGPDDAGVLLDGALGMGMRRLSIIDLATGGQPLANEDGSVWTVFNGEIYNYPELRERLLQRGHKLATHSDTEVLTHLYEDHGEDFVRHLFTVAASLDSMVVGEAQILAQVKQAYELATATSTVGPLTNAAFQAALKVAKRVATETAINQRRVSIPSVAVGDFASQFFERFDDKHVLVIGAGEMGEETLRYLIDAGVKLRAIGRAGTGA